MASEINFDLKSSTRARYMRIAVYPDGRVIVTKPIQTSEVKARDFVLRKSSWIRSKLDYWQNRKIVSLENPQISKDEALKFVKERLDFFNQHYEFQIGKVSIKNHKRLWGSCSSRTNLNFNHRIVLLPQHQADYIIVHELCHLKEFNHSPKFWNLIAQTIPNYHDIKQQLKDYQIG
jgi:predicted metal-dependent hydrolase